MGKKKDKERTNVSVTKDTHNKVKKFIETTGQSIAWFFDKAATEKLEREKK